MVSLFLMTVFYTNYMDMGFQNVIFFLSYIIHSSSCLMPGQDHSGSGVYPKNTNCEVGIHLEQSTIHPKGQFSGTGPSCGVF